MRNRRWEHRAAHEQDAWWSKARGQEVQRGEEMSPRKPETLQGKLDPKDAGELGDKSPVSQECDEDETVRQKEANEESQEMIMEGSAIDVEERVRKYLACCGILRRGSNLRNLSCCRCPFPFLCRVRSTIIPCLICH